LKRHILVLCGVAALALPTDEAHAFSLFGFTLFGGDDLQDVVIADPQPYVAELTVAGGDEAADAAVRAASELWSGRDRPASGAAGLLATARSDYRRIVSALYAEGYYGGTVSISVGGREATTLAPDVNLPDPVGVSIRVTTGPLFRFGSITQSNPAPGAPALGEAGLVSGEIARSGLVTRASARAVAAWRELGHPKARLADQEVIADHATNRVDVALHVSPGPRATLGPVGIEGAETVDAAFVVRQSGLVPGAVYSPADIAQARERLVALGVFTVVRIVEADTVAADGSLPLTIVVQERAPRRAGIGATYSSVDGLGIETFWLHRNLLGQAERLRLDARLAGIGYPVQTANFDYYFGGTFTKPGVWTPYTDAVAALIAQKTVLPRYTETSVEARLGFSHDFSPELASTFGINAKRANFLDPVYGVRDFTVLGTYGSLAYDTRDSTTDPTTGFLATLEAEPFYEGVYRNAALLVMGEGRTYFGFGEEQRFVLAGRLKLGALLGPPISETPPDKLFFAGGGGSVRGFPYRSIGVTAPGGAIGGGRFLTEASLEARMRVSEDFGIVGFVDAGYVTDETFVGLAAGTRIGVGAGLRYYTGFGPLRLDVAIPLNKRAGDPDYALYFGIGQAF